MRARPFWSRILMIVAGLAMASTSVAAARQDARLMTATQVLEELYRMPEQNIPTWLLERAYAVAVIPEVIKVGLAIGGRRGKGVLVVRKDDGSWSSPIFVNLTGGSVGFQLGVQSTDVVLVFTSRQSIEGIVGGKVTLGADASVAAGPVGRQSSAATDVGFTAQVYSYSRAKGLFLGVALDGSALTIDHRSNEQYYGRSGVLASEIMRFDTATAPATAQTFIAALRKSMTSPDTAAPRPATSPAQTPGTPAPASPSSVTTYPMEDPSPGTEPPP
jgi:lipid-binding SYLF domain-containing protein